MTAQEAISAIRAEIKRRYAELESRIEELENNDARLSIAELGERQNELEDVLSFLDTLKDGATSIPEGLDEAAREYTLEQDWQSIGEEIHTSFKAGAEWMAGQGATIEAKFIKSRLRGHISLPVFFKDGEQFNNGEDVIVHIRKK